MTTTAGTHFQRSGSLETGMGRTLDSNGRGSDVPPDKEALKLLALEAHSVRSEMKDWQNRSFMPAVASVPVVTAVQTLVANLTESNLTRLLVGVGALAILMWSARLSWYCRFAIDKGASYLAKYHQKFLEEHRQHETYSRDAHRFLVAFYLALASYLVFVLQPQADGLTIFLRIVGVGVVFSGLVFVGPSGPVRWKHPEGNQPSSRVAPHYIDAEIKTLREDIRDWQTRRFNLASLAIATVSLAAVTSAKFTEAVGAPCALGLIAISALFWLTETGDRANRAASRTLQTNHSEWFPWEGRICLLNKNPTFPRLQHILRYLYLTLAAILGAIALSGGFR